MTGLRFVILLFVFCLVSVVFIPVSLFLPSFRFEKFLVSHFNMSIVTLTSLCVTFSSCSRDYKIHTFHILLRINILPLQLQCKILTSILGPPPSPLYAIVLCITSTYTENPIRKCCFTFNQNSKEEKQSIIFTQIFTTSVVF